MRPPQPDPTWHNWNISTRSITPPANRFHGIRRPRVSVCPGEFDEAAGSSDDRGNVRPFGRGRGRVEIAVDAASAEGGVGDDAVAPLRPLRFPLIGTGTGVDTAP